MANMIRRMLVLAAMTGLAACGTLPRGAPTESEIKTDASRANSGIAFYQVNEALLPTVAQWPHLNSERTHGWPHKSPGSMGQLIAVGDTVNVKVWESSDNSLLAGPGQPAAELGAMRVSPSGTIFIPYVGEVRVAGLGPQRARQALQERLYSVSPSAQVQIKLEEGRQNSIDLVSGVASPGTYPMVDRNLSVLSAISVGGGVAGGLRNPRVKLLRGSKLYLTSIDKLYENPALDATLHAGDKLIVEEDDRYFLSLGASGNESLVYFPQDRVTALEAISLIGGVAESRADPEGILVLREYPRDALAAGVRGPREQRVIFSIDITEADGLFSARNLEIMPQDVVLATESPVSNLATALALFGTSFALTKGLIAVSN